MSSTIYCPRQEVFFNNQLLTFEKSEVYQVVGSQQSCESTGWCMLIEVKVFRNLLIFNT